LLYLLDKNVRTVRWNGEPLHEATSAIVKESMNGDFILTVKYPISDTGIYKRIKEDMLIKCPTPVLGPQLFRIKKPIEDNDQLEITAYHITDDIMQRSVKPVKVANQTCSIALSQMVQNTKTDLGDFSFTSDIQEHRTFNMTETENIYSVLLDGKHSIVGTWEGELVRDNFSLTVKKNRGENRGVVITTHKNLKSYQRSKNSQNVITRIHARSTFKPEGSEHETTIKVTVDSPLINSYPYINEKEYENNNAKTVEELKKWAQAKFTNEGIDKVSDSIKLEAYELDGQIVHLGDTVNLKSLKHNVDIFKKAVAYEYDGLKEEYISLEFDDKAGFGGSGVSNGLSDVTNAILGVTYSAQEIAIERAARNANLAFEHQSNQLKKEVEDGIELIKAKSEENKRSLSDEINRKFHDFSPEGFEEAKTKAEEALKQAKAGFNLADEAKYIADQNSITFASMANRVNKQDSAIKDNALKLAEYKETVSERIANLSSQMAGKVDQVEFQRVRETAQLYERILGGAENDVSRNVSRMVLSDQLFQTEVGKYVTDDNNLIVNSMTMDKHSLVNPNRNGVNISVDDGVFTIKAQGLTSYNFSGFTLPIYVKKIYRGETYTLGFKYRIREKVDTNFVFTVKNHVDNKMLLSADVAKPQDEAGVEWWEFQKTFTVQEDFAFGENPQGRYPFYIYMAKNGWVEFKEPILVRGSKTGPYKPSQFDDAYKMTEATRTQVTQLAGSYAIQNLNSAGDLINGINIGANGHNRFVGKLTHITGETLIDNAVIKSAMIDKLKTANFEAGSVTTTILGAEAVTAEKVKFDTAFIQKLVSQQAFIDELFAKQATITQIQSIDITGEHVKGGKLTSLNGVTDFDLQTGWIDMNGFGVGIKNKFPNRPLQYLVFGAGNINGVDASYTALMSNRNGLQASDHTSAGLQIWNGRTGDNVQSAINMYGRRITFNQSAQAGLREISIDTDTNTISGADEIYIKGVRLSLILNDIYDNFRNLAAVPGNYSRGYHSQWR
jgi:phage minor structural protein, N-terminal domain protein